MGKSLFERIHLDFLPSIQRVSSISLSNALNSHIGEDSCHIWTDINSAHSFNALPSHQIVRMGSVRWFFFDTRPHHNCRALITMNLDSGVCFALGGARYSL